MNPRLRLWCLFHCSVTTAAFVWLWFVSGPSWVMAALVVLQWGPWAVAEILILSSRLKCAEERLTVTQLAYESESDRVEEIFSVFWEYYTTGRSDRAREWLEDNERKATH